MGSGKVLGNFIAQLFIQNMWNFETEQKPGLTLVLSRDKKTPAHLGKYSFNTNPFLASFLTGVISKHGYTSSIPVLETSLAAVADDFYWRVVRPFFLLAGLVLCLFGWPLAGLVCFLAGFNLFAQLERLTGYRRGVKLGLAGVSLVTNRLARIKRIVLPAGGILVGFLIAFMLFSVGKAGFFIGAPRWFVALPVVAASLVFALFRISPLLNLAFNLIFVMVIQVVL